MNDLKDIVWVTPRSQRPLPEHHYPEMLKGAFFPFPNSTKNQSTSRRQHTVDTMSRFLVDISSSDADRIMDIALRYHAEDEAFMVFSCVVQKAVLREERNQGGTTADAAFLDDELPLDDNGEGRVGFPYMFVLRWIEACPTLVFTLLKICPPIPPPESDDATSTPSQGNEDTGPRSQSGQTPSERDSSTPEPPEPLQAGDIHPVLSGSNQETGIDLTLPILRSILLSANSTKIASLVALEKLGRSIGRLSALSYMDLIMLAVHSVRSRELMRDVVGLIDRCRREFWVWTGTEDIWGSDSQVDELGEGSADIGEEASRDLTVDDKGVRDTLMLERVRAAETYAQRHILGIALDRAEDAANECPCDEDGRPRRKMRGGPPQHAKLTWATLTNEERRRLGKVGRSGGSQANGVMVKAEVRIDGSSAVRLHSHIRLVTASKADNKWQTNVDIPVLDGLVVQATRGELKIQLVQLPPPEMERMDWNLYNAGSVATTNAMIDALRRLLTEKGQCCSFYSLIVGGETTEDDTQTLDNLVIEGSTDREEAQLADTLNESQITAVKSWRAPLALIWGPPGTGKTTVIIQVLRDILQTHTVPPKILMTASTHNAVDNVLERFVRVNRELNLLRDDQILRVATDVNKVNQALHGYTINARVGGDVNENNKLLKMAQERVEKATIVFTTCAGAGLGVLRKVDFDIALIDEASQITEPCALIPLVKGIKRAVVVGDHVQLRPVVGEMAKEAGYDVSLLERMYGVTESPFVAQTMLDVQYRSPSELNAFPSQEFYEGRLRTSDGNRDVANFLAAAQFPWPVRDGVLCPAVFVQCDEEEDMGGQSKGNAGQVQLVKHIAPLLKAPIEGIEETRLADLSVTVLTPYTKQVQMLRRSLGSTPCSTVDSFQGRESDIVIFSTVRSNVEHDIGFLEDHRRLNVMWTRAPLGLIIVGDARTLRAGGGLWERALNNCVEVQIAVTNGQD